MIDLQIDTNDLRKIEKTYRHIKDAMPRVLSPTINRTLNKGRTEVRREIRKDYVIKQKDIPVRVKGASRARLNGELIITSTMLPLAMFKIMPAGVQHRKRKQIIRAMVRAGHGGSLPHAFVAIMPSGHRGVFERVGKERLPIRELLAIGAAVMAKQPRIMQAVTKAMSATFQNELHRNAQRILKGKS